MRALIILTIIALAYAGKVHDFHAESNFICQLCKETMTLLKNKDVEQIQYIFDTYPALSNKLEAILNDNLEPSEQVCYTQNLCQHEMLDAQETQGLDLSIIDHVNSVQSSWKAEENPRFKGMSKAQIKKMMGTVVDKEWTYKKAPVKHALKQLRVSLPTNFDLRTQYPQCPMIGHARDQSNCGSCWAHGTTEAYNDRLCIKTNGQFTTPLSTADTTGCCGFLSCFSMGCNGGQIGTPWSWFKNTGVVTGGDFGDKNTCYPYTMQQCAHHVNSTTLPSCSDVKQVSPTCDKKCQGNNADYNADKHKASSSYSLGSIDAIKQDLVQYGSVTAAFTVYEDFVNYKSGIYKYTSGSALGGHAVKIVGWGNENGTDYWIVMNSWNETWGENGSFRIAFGQCGIDSQVHAGQA